MVQHTLGTVDARQSFSLIMLGLTRDFKEGGLKYSPPKAVTCKGRSKGILPCKIFKIEVLGNGISCILRPSQLVVMSHVINLWGLD